MVDTALQDAKPHATAMNKKLNPCKMTGNAIKIGVG